MWVLKEFIWRPQKFSMHLQTWTHTPFFFTLSWQPAQVSFAPEWSQACVLLPTLVHNASAVRGHLPCNQSQLTQQTADSLARDSCGFYEISTSRILTRSPQWRTAVWENPCLKWHGWPRAFMVLPSHKGPCIPKLSYAFICQGRCLSSEYFKITELRVPYCASALTSIAFINLPHQT